MDKFWEIVSKWDPFGQGLFFLLLAFIVFHAFLHALRFTVILFRGWPPPDVTSHEQEEYNDDGNWS